MTNQLTVDQLMWRILKNDIKMKIREYQIADNITGLDEYAEIEADTLDGVIQIMDGLERDYKEDNEND